MGSLPVSDSGAAMPRPIHVVGAGLAGSEAAVQIARHGVPCVLHEMRPGKRTPAHQTDALGELVCSNSLKTETQGSAPWLLKEELRRMGAMSMRVAAEVRIPGGTALTVDRGLFARGVTDAVESEPLIKIERGEVTDLATDSDKIWIIATGPLTSDALAEAIAERTGNDRLYFYDAISPIVDAETIDMSVAYRGSRYGHSIDGSDDYVNCPLTKEQYERFLAALLAAEQHHSSDFDNPNYFEGCLPIEEIARRGADTLRFGPMKPVGLRDPRTGRGAYAVVQLRQEDARAGSYNVVGFQNHLKYGEQKRLLRMIPGLGKSAEFLAVRPDPSQHLHQRARPCCCPTLQWRQHAEHFVRRPDLGSRRLRRVDGHRSGGGLERSSAVARGEASAGMAAYATAHGSLCHYISGASPGELPACQHHVRPAAASVS